MKQYHDAVGKKVSRGTGGRKKKSKDKSLAHVGGSFTSTKIADKDVRVKVRTRGGNTRLKLKKSLVMSVVTKDGAKKAKVLRVLESHNPEFVRTNIITKGAVVETDLGKAKVTNRVGQDGIVNGVLIS